MTHSRGDSENDMEASNLQIGDIVEVDLGEARGTKEAVIMQTPPFDYIICGHEYTTTDKVEVEYPSSAQNRTGIGNMRERVKLDNVTQH